MLYRSLTGSLGSESRLSIWPELQVVDQRVSKHSGDASCIQFIRDRLQNCCSGHPGPCNTPNSEIPRRLVDIGSHSSLIYLREYPNGIFSSHERTVQYSALSYCWGDPTRLLKTLTTNLNQHKSGIPREILPLTIQDAISISLQLNLKYIWIDCLCIIQDDKTDWEIESSKMGTYYRGAHLTIAATSSTDACQGIFSERPVGFTGDLAFVDEEGKRHELVVQPALDYQGNFGTLGERAWAFQENALSKRIVHFTETGIAWECNEGFSYEDGRTLDWLGVKSRMKKDEGHWARLLESFSTRKLTHLSVKLAAISGIAATIHEQTGNHYVAGLWEETLLYDLCWTSEYWFEPLYKGFNPVPQPIEAPSWSWASINVSIYWINRHPNVEFSTYSKVTRVECSALGSNPFAGFVEGCVEIEGLVSQGTVIFDDGTMDFVVALEMSNNTKYTESAFRPDTGVDVVRNNTANPSGLPRLRRADTPPKPLEAELTCLWLRTSFDPTQYTEPNSYVFGLAIAESDSKPGYFSRVGSVDCWILGRHLSWVSDNLKCSYRRVCLV